MAEKISKLGKQLEALDFLLEHPDLCKIYADDKGFHVRRDAEIKRGDGLVERVNDALDRLGFVDGQVVGSYNVQVKDVDENLRIFKFWRKASVVESGGVFD